MPIALHEYTAPIGDLTRVLSVPLSSILACRFLPLPLQNPRGVSVPSSRWGRVLYP
jgi:hypothetical protein